MIFPNQDTNGEGVILVIYWYFVSFIITSGRRNTDNEVNSHQQYVPWFL